MSFPLESYLQQSVYTSFDFVVPHDLGELEVHFRFEH